MWERFQSNGFNNCSYNNELNDDVVPLENDAMFAPVVVAGCGIVAIILSPCSKLEISKATQSAVDK